LADEQLIADRPDGTRSRTVDLHTHTTASDGTYSPARLVELAGEYGLSAIAITDHDTVAGISEATEAGARTGVEVVAGIEISVEYPRDRGVMHILGYDLDTQSPALLEALEWVQEWRRDRNPRMVDRLREMGIDVSIEDVEAVAGGGQIGRPHIARAMVANGAVGNLQEAFDRYLQPGAPAYVDKGRLGREKAMDAIRGAGGVTVLAHPGQLGIGDGDRLRSAVEELVDIGLCGIEAHYKDHSPERTATYVDMAERLGLVATCGSDFHGDSDSAVHPWADGSPIRQPYAVLERLRAAP